MITCFGHIDRIDFDVSLPTQALNDRSRPSQICGRLRSRLGYVSPETFQATLS